jgi:hypothetical protein
MEIAGTDVFHLGGLVGRREYALLGGAAEQAAKEAAAKAAQDAASQAAKAAAEKAAKDAAEKAAKDAAEQASKDAAEQAAKDAAEQASKDAADQAAKDAAEKTAKDEADKAAKDAAEAQAEADAKAAGKDVSKKAGDYAKYAAAAGAAAVGLYTYASSSDAADKSNNTPRNITKITPGDGTSYNVFFDPAIKILQTDSLNITGSKTSPTIDGPQTVGSVVSDSQITIDFGQTLTDTTPGGSIKVTTTTDAQIADTVTSAASTAGSAVGGAAGGAFGNFLKQLGIDPKVFMYVGIALGVIVLIVIVLVVIGSMKKKAPTVPAPSVPAQG